MKEVYFTRRNSQVAIDLPDEKLKSFLIDNYNFEVGYVPEGYNAAFLMLQDNEEQPLEDSWEIIFFKKNNIQTNETITLDNINSMNETEVFYEELKRLQGNFEDILETTVELVTKYSEE